MLSVLAAMEDVVPAPRGNQYAKGLTGYGRPSKYMLEHCDAVIEMGKEGLSLAEMADRLEVSIQTIYNWANAHEEFFEALQRAKTSSQAWWERDARENLRSKEYNAALWAKSMAGRFREVYGSQPVVQTNVQNNTVRHADADPRQIARAVLAIIERAQIQVVSEEVDDVEEIGDDI